VTLGLFYYLVLVALPPPPPPVPITPTSSPPPASTESSKPASKHQQLPSTNSLLASNHQPAKGGPIASLLPAALTNNFRALCNAQLRRLFIRLLLPPKATRALDDWRQGERLKGLPEPSAPELWWEGSAPSAMHMRKQHLVNALYKVRRLVRAAQGMKE
jgi:hypothetical protein